MVTYESRRWGKTLPALHVVLAPREISIARLVAGALTNREIARKLDIAENTVQWNLHRIYQGLGLRSRRELMLWWAVHRDECNLHAGVEVEHPPRCRCAWCAEAA